AGCIYPAIVDHPNRMGDPKHRCGASYRWSTMDKPDDGNGRSTMKPTPTYIDPALVLDVMAQLFSAGTSLPAGLQAVGTHLPGCQPLTLVADQLLLGMDWDIAWQHVQDDPQLKQLGDELRFVHISAVPSAHILTTAATALRANRKRMAEQLAQELSIRLVLPTGICMLPSFILLGIIPMVLALLPGCTPPQPITQYGNPPENTTEHTMKDTQPLSIDQVDDSGT